MPLFCNITHFNNEIMQLINVREKVTYNEEWTIQRQWKHFAHKTHKKTTKAKHKRLKRRVTRTPPKPKGKEITTQLNPKVS
jgi:hypothetical protein